MEDCERIFIEMICSIERRRFEVKQLIRAQEKAEISRADRLLKQLEWEIDELKRDATVDSLSYAIKVTVNGVFTMFGVTLTLHTGLLSLQSKSQCSANTVN